MTINEEKNEVYHNICIAFSKKEWKKFISQTTYYLQIPVSEELTSPSIEGFELCNHKIENLIIDLNSRKQRYEIPLPDIDNSLKSFCIDFENIKIDFLFSQKGIIKIQKPNYHYVRFESKVTKFHPRPKEVEIIITTSFLSNLTGIGKILSWIFFKINRKWYLEWYPNLITPEQGMMTPITRINEDNNLEFIYIFKGREINIGIGYQLPCLFCLFEKIISYFKIFWII